MMSDLQLMELEDELKSVDTFLEHLKTEEAQTLFHQDLFHSFEAMKTAAPGMSRQAFTAMLDQRTKQYGRTGKVNADAFQRSFLQFVYCNYEENQLLGKEPLVCPACSPEMVAVSVDGNRKLYRFQKTNQSEEPGFFDGVFLARDSEVSSFVEEVRGTVKSTAGKAMCGDTQWNAARETSKRANKLDEEGVEIAVCRHGFLLKGLNMYRGEIFAYPMFLQKEFQSATFLAMDVTCRYVPYLTSVRGPDTSSTPSGNEALLVCDACQSPQYKMRDSVDCKEPGGRRHHSR
ncbi:uncharacterized protein LOC124469733 [Hypomesus transpacificus]|uniref:uncharacterized protein LOC124469733 n=1 Tax=Hypomesus transpacificus TaxID=137520 RepID=UPI001F08125E|nr:uncharacterized protein LOC124469733 [Hypomesus transpacificus]